MIDTSCATLNYDISNKHEFILNELKRKYYRLKHAGKLKDMKLNSLNIKAVRMINETKEEYESINELFILIKRYLSIYTHDDDFQEYHHAIYVKIACLNRIIDSNLEQFKKIEYLKYIVKGIPISIDQYKAINHCIKKINSRISNLKTNILPEYIKLTPIFDYINIQNISILELLNEISDHISIIKDKDNYKYFVDSYIKYINLTIKEQCEWRKHFTTVMSNELINIEKGEKRREENKYDFKFDRANKAQENLFKQSYSFSKIYEYSVEGCYCGYNGNNSMLKFKSKALKYKECHNCNEAKIILLAKTRAGSRAKMHFYNELSDNLMSNGILNATILPLNAELPKEIQELIDSYDMVFTELIV